MMIVVDSNSGPVARRGGVEPAPAGAVVTPDTTTGIAAGAPNGVVRLLSRPLGTRSSTPVDRTLQLTLSTAIVIVCWITVRPLGLTGLAGLTLVLLVVNSILIFARNLPPLVIAFRTELLVIVVWAALAACLLSLKSLGVAPAFAYFVSGHAGYRLRGRVALAVAGTVGGLSAICLAITSAQGVDGWPWPLGFTVALPVFIGMANRSRDAAVTSALEAAAAAQRAAESEARAQALAERARISRDIHDVLAHSLSGVSMQLELSEALLENGQTDRARDAISKAHSMVREGMTEVRRAVQASRAEVLPLGKTLQSLFSATATVAILGPVRELSTEMTQTLVRVAQESLTNARRHAAGAPIVAELRYRADAVSLEVANGPGGTAGRGAGSGMGLVGMRERVALLDGEVEAGPITQGPLTGGWRVAVTLPG